MPRQNVAVCVWTPSEKGLKRGGESWKGRAAAVQLALEGPWKVVAQERLHAASTKREVPY